MKYPDLTNGENIDTEWWQKAAQNTIRRYCGWHVAPNVYDTLTLDAHGGRSIMLPTQHVMSIDSVYLDDTIDLTGELDWSESGYLRLRSKTFPDRPRCITVTLYHGYEPDEVPEVIMLMRSLARRARTQPLVSSQSVNGASASYLTAGGAPLSIPLLDIEKRMLDPYRIEWGVT